MLQGYTMLDGAGQRRARGLHTLGNRVLGATGSARARLHPRAQAWPAPARLCTTLVARPGGRGWAARTARTGKSWPTRRGPCTFAA